FSAQFVAFAGYQYARMIQGEMPLWNPYNNAGFPFIGDTQAAVFYLPRWVTIALAHAGGGWAYHALELEMTAHVLMFSLLMYLLVRRLTIGAPRSHVAALVSAITASYSGFLSGYPPLQLAILEAAVWLPLSILGIHEATRSVRLWSPWLLLAAVGIGLSWLAGHPQTSYFLTLLAVAYNGYRLAAARSPWFYFIVHVGIVGVVSAALAAAQLLPGLEYLTLTARPGLGFDAKDNGFPFQDIIQFFYPGVVSLFSPLHVGVFALVLAGIAVALRATGAIFWAAVALIALLWSFGGNSVIYPLLYQIMPGLRFFRGQERAAYLVSMSLAILAGLGITRIRWIETDRHAILSQRLRGLLDRILIAALILSGIVFAVWLAHPDQLSAVMSRIAFGTLMIALLRLFLPPITDGRWPSWLIVGLIVFELFSLYLDADSTYDPTSPHSQIAIAPPEWVEPVLSDRDIPFRVDGFRGLGGNFGSLYGVADIRGISPLFLSSIYRLVESDLPDERAWEILAVRYVYSDWRELPVPTTIVYSGSDLFGLVNLHRLDQPRPFAQVMFDTWVAADGDEALEVVFNPAVDLRRVAVVESEPPFADDPSLEPIPARVVSFAPETIVLEVSTPRPGLLSIALPYYPGWRALSNGRELGLMRIYGALSGILLDAGDHQIALMYDPLSYRVGLSISLAMAALIGTVGLLMTARAALVTVQRHRGLHAASSI
ncbi:MAG: YfhO family protein, partial [Anaerolinea sp.]|nr:YfhO family protein [Anaerolinea sp.]